MREANETCTRVREHLPLYVGDDLEPELRDELRGHLEACAPCAAAAEGAAEAREAFRTCLAEGTAGAGLWTGVRAGLRREGILSDGRARRGPERAKRRRRIVTGVQLAAAAGIAAFLLGRSGGPLPDAGDAGSPRVALPATSPTAAGEPLLAEPLFAEPVGLRRVGWGEERLLGPDGEVAAPPGTFFDEDAADATRPRLVPHARRADGNQLAGYR